MDSKIDDADRRLLALLERNARASLKELAAELNLSPPAVSERMRKLEARGVIRGYTVEVDPKALGLTIEALVRVRPLPGRLHLVQSLIEETPAITECVKVTGEDCFVARLRTPSVEAIDTVLETFSEYAETNTSIVKRTPVRSRLPPL